MLLAFINGFEGIEGASDSSSSSIVAIVVEYYRSGSIDRADGWYEKFKGYAKHRAELLSEA